MKFASTQTSPVSTRLNSDVPAVTNWPNLNDDAWLTMPSAGARTVVCDSW